MSRLSSYLDSLSTYLPYIIITVVSLALILLIVLATITIRSIKKAGKRRMPAPPPPKPKPKTDESLKEPVGAKQKMPPWGGRLSQYFSRKGYFHVGAIGLSFVRALDLLRKRIESKNSLYRLPWYLLIGPSHSGKTSMMSCSEQVLPLGTPDFDIKDDNPAVRWWFLNRCVVLDLKGSLLISQEGVKSQEESWRSVVSLLGRYRSKRPLDGVILTLSASELYGPHKLTLDDISERARYLAQKLNTTQSNLGIQLPVYVVVTKCDLIPGFKQFCQASPHDNRHNMLGWSCPYTLTAAYSPGWIDEAFEAVHKALYKIGLEILTQGEKPTLQDGVFIFPLELLHLKRHITPYLNNIFKPSGYEESLLFRGLYFCGDSGIGFNLEDMRALPPRETPSIQDEAYSLLSEKEKKADDRYRSEHTEFVRLRIGDIDLEDPVEKPHSIYFFNEVLNQKVAAETGLARPIQHRLHRRNRALKIAQISTAGATLIGLWGLMHAYERYRHNRDLLIPVLGKITTILHEIPHYRLGQTSFTVSVFEDQSRQLIEMMNNIERSTFFSTFVPSSWFSPLSTRLQTTIKISYDQIILRTIYMDLVLKARDLLNLRPPSPGLPQSLGVQLQPTATQDYQVFKNYVEQFINLHRHIDKYNRLKEVNDPDLLKDLVAYTLRVQLPKTFIDNYKHFYEVLQEIPYPYIDLNAYGAPARETLQILYFNFLNGLLSPANPHSIIGNMDRLLHSFTDSEKTTKMAIAELRQFSRDMDQSISMLGEPGRNWIDAPFFDPGDGFSNLMGEISQFPLFGKGMIDQFVAETSLAFELFQNDLQRLNNLLVEGPMPLLDSGEKKWGSQGVFALQKGLSIFFKQPFMAMASGTPFNGIVPENQVVFWNKKLVEAACDLTSNFDDFSSKNIVLIPHGLRDTLKLLGHRNLQENILDLIARAQTFSLIRSDHHSAYGAEEVLVDKIADVRAISPLFIKLLHVLEGGNIGQTYVELRTLLGTLSTRLLQNVQTILDSYALYTLKDGSFEWWDGVGSPILQGFSARDSQDLKSYLIQQRDLIRHLAIDFAEPMVGFLSHPIMEKYQGEPQLVALWQRLIQQVKSADKKRPDSTLLKLEDFIQKNLCSMNMKVCKEFLQDSSVNTTSGDYFTDILYRLKKSLRSRCEVLTRHQSIENYQNLSKAFNDTLKGKFPFVGGIITPSTPECDPEDIRAFFKLYDELGGTPDVVLDQLFQLGSATLPLYDFLKSMGLVKTFFQSYLTAADPSSPPSFDFSIDFRTNQDREVNGNQIIEWMFAPNDSAVISNHDKNRYGRWVYGDAVSLSLRWPDASQTKPFRDQGQPLLSISGDGQTASFNYPGRWSFLWFIWKQSAQGSDFANMRDGAPYNLKFDIPNGPDKKTTVFTRITLLAPGKGKAPGQPISIPNFPSKAPDISADVIKQADRPILTNRAVLGASVGRGIPCGLGGGTCADEKSQSQTGDKSNDLDDDEPAKKIAKTKVSSPFQAPKLEDKKKSSSTDDDDD